MIDTEENFRRIKELAEKFPLLEKEEVEELRDLSGNIRVYCEDVLYDWNK